MLIILNLSFIMAHPDDGFVWCGGLILECAKLGARFTVISLSKTNSVDEERIEKSYSSLGVTYNSFGKKDAGKKKIMELLIKDKPDIIISHWDKDTHEYHRETSLIAASAIEELKFELYKTSSNANLRFLQCDTYYSIGRNGQPFPGKTIIDISGSFEKKMFLLTEIKDKYFSIIEPMVKIQNAFYGGKIGKKYAEAFLDMPTLASIDGGFSKTTAQNLLSQAKD